MGYREAALFGFSRQASPGASQHRAPQSPPHEGADAGPLRLEDVRCVCAAPQAGPYALKVTPRGSQNGCTVTTKRPRVPQKALPVASTVPNESSGGSNVAALSSATAWPHRYLPLCGRVIPFLRLHGVRAAEGIVGRTP
jgi:hypothetical protein